MLHRLLAEAPQVVQLDTAGWTAVIGAIFAGATALLVQVINAWAAARSRARMEEAAIDRDRESKRVIESIKEDMLDAVDTQRKRLESEVKKVTTLQTESLEKKIEEVKTGS